MQLASLAVYSLRFVGSLWSVYKATVLSIPRNLVRLLTPLYRKNIKIQIAQKYSVLSQVSNF